MAGRNPGRARTRAARGAPLRFAACLALVLTLSPGRGHAQDALVLGGGAARGIAHTGVLIGIERLGYDPEILVGTSMGAIIGALYASGYTPSEIRVIMEMADWLELFAPMARPLGPARSPHRPQLRLKLGGERFDADEGLVPAWRVNRKLARLLFRPAARARGDFDNLPRRFRAVAADLATGEAAILGKGDLARAVRASMAVPGVFAPVHWNGRLLVDGGIAWYLPIPAARALGAEHVIAADVIRPPPGIQAGGAMDVGTRAFRLLLLNALPENARPDELILPPIEPDVSSALFPRDPSELIRAGLVGTLRDLGPAPGAEPLRADTAPRRTTERPRGLHAPAEGAADPQRGRNASQRRAADPAPLPAPAAFAGLAVEVTDPALEPFVRAAFADLAPGPYRPEEVLERMDRLYATGLFEGVWPYATTPRDAMADSLLLEVYADPRAPIALEGTAGWDNDRGFRGWASLDGRAGGGVPVLIGLSAAAGELDRGATFSLRRPIAALPPLFLSAGGYVRDHDARVFARGELIGNRDVDRAGGWAGAELRGIEPDYLAALLLRAERVSVDGGEEGLSIGPFLRVGDPSRSTRVVGVPENIVAEIRFGDVDYSRVKATGSLDFSPGRFLLAALAAVSLTGGNAPPDTRPALGDRHAVPGFRWGQRRGTAAVVAGLDVAYPIPMGGYARVRLRAGRAPSATRLDAFTDLERWEAGAGVGLVLPTPFGRIEAGVGVNTADVWRVNVSIGAEP